MDSHWLEILFFLIGEHAECNADQVSPNSAVVNFNGDHGDANGGQHSDHCHCVEVNGAVVNVRSKGDKLAVWVADCANTEAVVSL